MSLKKTIEYGSYLLLFILPWQPRWIFHEGKIAGGTSEYLSYSLYASDILMIILLCLAGAHLWRARQSSGKREFSYAKSVLAMVAGMFFAYAIVKAPDRNLAMFITLRLALTVAAMRLLLTFAEKAAAAFWLAAGLVPAAWLGIWQFLTQGTFASKWLGLAQHVAAEPGTSVIERYPVGQLPERWLRAYGSFDHPNILGGAMTVGLILSLWLLAERYYQKGQEKWRMALYLIISSLAAGLFVSFSRGAWLGLFLGALFSLLAMAWLKRWDELRAWLVGLAIIAALFGLFMLPYRDLATGRFAAQTRLEIKSTTERLASYKQASALIKHNLLTGVGLGNYIPALERAEPGQPAWYYQPAHNSYLLVLAEFGLIGLILLAIILATYILADQLPAFSQLSKEQLKTRKLIENYGQFDPLVTVMTVSIGTMMLFDHWWWSLHFGVLLFWIVVGLAVLPKKNTLQ
jgi:hypothetical protein